MKRIIISLLVLASLANACTSYTDYRNQHGDATVTILSMFREYVKDPTNLLDDFSPFFTIQSDKEADKIMKALSPADARKYRLRREKQLRKVEMWKNFYRNLDADTIMKYGLKFVYDEDYRTYKLYSAMDDVYILASMAVISHNVAKYMPEGKTVLREAKKGEYVYSPLVIAGDGEIGRYMLEGRIVYLYEGSRNWGFKHIELNHNPWNLQLRFHNKNSFVMSAPEYIVDKLETFLYSMPERVKSGRKGYAVYEKKLPLIWDERMGIMYKRTYRMVIRLDDNIIVTFYPTESLPAHLMDLFPEYKFAELNRVKNRLN